MVPLSGAVTVVVDDDRFELAGRIGVFAGPTDVAYVGIGTGRSSLHQRAGRTVRALRSPHRGGAAAAPARRGRGAGRAARGRVSAAGRCATSARRARCRRGRDHRLRGDHPGRQLVVLSGAQARRGQSSTSPCWRRSTTSRSRPDRTASRGSASSVPPSSPGHEIDLCEEVRDRDVVLVPHGWHGPAAAAPGHDMYYLNVMAGPGPERAWKITDHPEQAWIREHLGRAGRATPD